MKAGRFNFSSPVPLGAGYVCPCPGVYLISSYRAATNDYFVVYIGESRNMNERIGPSHHKWACWHQYPALNVSFLEMRHSTADERRQVEAELIREFNPPCNG